MNALDGIEGLSECISQAIQEHLERSNIAWPQIDALNHPILRFEAFIEDAGQSSATVQRSERVASVCTILSFGGDNILQVASSDGTNTLIVNALSYIPSTAFGSSSALL
jgi:hypothetical protein